MRTWRLRMSWRSRRYSALIVRPIASLTSSACCRRLLLHSMHQIPSTLSSITANKRLANMSSTFSSPPSSPLPFHSLPIDDSARYPFGPHLLSASQLFVLTPLSYASVNLAPVVPGHALICPRRPCLRVSDMLPEELTDCWLVAQAVGRMLTERLKCPALTFAIQDGKEAGQSVPHVHIHVMPRREGDFQRNDDIYGEMEKPEHSVKPKEEEEEEEQRGPHVDTKASETRKKWRTAEQMKAEAAQWRIWMSQLRS